jgi:glycosyltransferase involved in cell wall biosynthesis
VENKIAVILPIYKGDKVSYVQLSIDSILNQSYSNIHLYIGVDGPVERLLADCLNQYKKEEMVTIQWFPENRGLAIVLNDLLDICFQEGYDFIARMDADDISSPYRLEKQISFLQANPQIDVVGGAIEEINENSESRGKIIIYPATPQDCYQFFSRRNPHAHPAVMFRKSFFDKAGCKYRPEYRQNQDTMLWYDGLMKGVKMANIPDVVLRFRMTDSLFKKRRNGWAFAKKQLQDRLMINKGLHYGFYANLFAYAMFALLIAPPFVKKIAYRVLR